MHKNNLKPTRTPSVSGVATCAEACAEGWPLKRPGDTLV
jgi:hypothetical protein